MELQMFLGQKPKAVENKIKSVKNFQEEKWDGDFGNQYIAKNDVSADEMDKDHEIKMGISKTSLNYEFLNSLDRDIKILEIGSSTGNQLALLQKMGFKNLWGLEINEQAVDIAQKTTKNIYFCKGSILDIPFKDGFFNLVFTSAVLMHVHPNNLSKAFSELYRVSNNYIWCYEYFSKGDEQLNYRGETDILWMRDFMKLFSTQYPDLKIIKEKNLTIKDIRPKKKRSGYLKYFNPLAYYNYIKKKTRRYR